MSLPLRTRGILSGLITLAVSPLIAVTVLSGSPTHSISPAAVASAEPRPTSAASATAAGHRVGVRIPELAVRDPEPTPVPAPAPAPDTATPMPTSTPAPVRVAPKVVARVQAPAPQPPAPQPQPVSRPAAPSGSIESIIRDAAGRHGVSGDWMMKIARCESGLNPRAVNPGGYYGLFQFSPRTFQAHGGTDIYDPYQQSEITATMLSQGQARQWSCA